MAHAMVASYGMSPAIGPVSIGEKQGEVFLGRDLANRGTVAAATLELVDSETRRLVRAAEDTAQQVIKQNGPVLEDLANTLLEQETLTGAALEVFLSAVAPWPAPLLPLQTNGGSSVRMRIRIVDPAQPTGEIGRALADPSSGV
jgi:cell division protease FtsH